MTLASPRPALATPRLPKSEPAVATRWALVDAMRAVAAAVIAAHHFALYPPLSNWARPILADSIPWLRTHGRIAPVFFALGGYVMARTMSERTWRFADLGRFLLGRYCRLAAPYLVVVAVAVAACAIARGYIPESVIGPPLTWQQVAAHVFFLQDILDQRYPGRFESLSTGLWFVGIYFQLVVLYAVLLCLRDAVARRLGPRGRGTAQRMMMAVCWTLAIASLFYFNRYDHWNVWAVYFFCHLFLGIMVYEGLKNTRGQILFWIYVALMGLAVGQGLLLTNAWRWRLIDSLVPALLLFAGGKLALIDRWPRSRIVGYLGRSSYSFFLVHFSVLVLVATLWVRAGWNTPWAAVAGLLVAAMLSLAAAAVIYRWVEVPVERVVRRYS
ncbi:MAG: acyltransferase family protein [Planctomycetia bacterium]|nr:acyltransferase family protein [Planctomycetia bacterium]